MFAEAVPTIRSAAKAIAVAVYFKFVIFFSGGSYVIESNNSILAVAEQRGRTFSFDLGTRQYQLCPESHWKRSFVLLEGERQVGRIYFETGEVIAELPANLSLPVRVFMLWLIVLLWNRDLTTILIAST